MTGLERGFVVLVVVVAAALAGFTTVQASSNTEPSVAFDPGVPTSYEFDAVNERGVATVDGRQYDSLQRAVDAAAPGDTVVLRGRFDERVVVNTTGLTLVSAPGSVAAVDGGGVGDVLTIEAANVTVRRVWIRNSGFDTASNDAGVWIDAPNVTLTDSRVTGVTFGVWVDGVDDASLRNNTIVGRDSVSPRSYRGNGVQLFKTEGTSVVGNRITDARDGIYYSWASGVETRDNVLWDLRYGVHYMYSDDNRLENNTAFDNDVGFALMLSEDIRVVNNTAVNNTGTSGHGILLKRIDDSTVRGNHLVGNTRGLYALNSVRNTVADNLVMRNRVGAHFTAGTREERVVGNSFIDNGQAVLAVTSDRHAWNGSGRGNYWAAAKTADLDDDGVSELRHRPAGIVEAQVQAHPTTAVFARSPAFEVVRRAERALPVLDTPGVVDHHPLTTPPHDNWRQYHERDTHE